MAAYKMLGIQCLCPHSCLPLPTAAHSHVEILTAGMMVLGVGPSKSD